MLGKIEYHRPTHQDRRKRAGFWLALGSFLGSTLIVYLACSALMVIAFIIFVAKLISKI